MFEAHIVCVYCVRPSEIEKYSCVRARLVPPRIGRGADIKFINKNAIPRKIVDIKFINENAIPRKILEKVPPQAEFFGDFYL